MDVVTKRPENPEKPVNLMKDLARLDDPSAKSLV